MADRSFTQPPLEHYQQRTRQASATSSGQSSASDNNPTSSHPRRRRVSPTSRTSQASSGNTSEHNRRKASKQASSGARESLSRGLLNMSGPVDPAGEITYTPTTHRISKAKKGKKVHTCEFPGCGKVFTRAEHRKRHEANHNAEPAFQCQVEDCRKPFQRSDLLARHMERQHEMPVETSRGPRSHRATSEASSNPSNAGMLPSSLSHSPPVSGPGMSQGTMSITSIIEHPSGTTFPRSAHTMGEFSQHMAIASHPRSFHPEYMYGAMGSADSPMYSSDSCYSPMSDYPGPQIASQSFGHHEGMIPRPPSTFSEPSLQPNPIASPLSVGPSFPPMWSSIDATSGLDASYHPTLLADQALLSYDGMTLSEDLFANSSVQHVYDIHQRWVDIEARRRVLVAAFVLDIQCSVLFQCEPCFPLRSDSEPLDLPFPSSQELWDSIEMDTWQMLLTNWYPPSLRFLAHPLPPLDILQSSLLACHQLHRQSFKPPPLHPPKSLQLPAQISHEALSLSSLTPRHALIITASESWLFGTKIAEQSVWQDAKTTLRKWAESESAARAVWHAVRLLRMAFGAAEEQRLGQMHELWCLYLAGLVCWAFGYDRPFSAGFAKGEEKKTKKRGAAADTKG
ncbi:MAG: hypothetical protein Q9190_001892, partial [Brigantiaea leucoxantha]